MDAIHGGSIVFYRITMRAQPMLPTDVEALVVAHGVPPSLVPTYAGDRTAVTRALNTTRSGVAKQGILLRPIKSTATLLVHGIVQEQKDLANERVDHDFKEALRWDGEANGAHITGSHAVAQLADVNYQNVRGRIVGDDWTDVISSYLQNECHAQLMRPTGGVFWVPQGQQALLGPLKAFLGAVGILLVSTPVGVSEVAEVQEIVAENLLVQLEELATEVQDFDGTQASATYKQRLETYGVLRKRCTMYREVLGLMAEQMQGLLDQLATKVQDLLTIRDNTIVHKDGSLDARPVKKALPKTW